MLRAVGFKATGTLHIINETQQVSARFQKREFVVTLADNPRYPQTVQFQLTGNRCDALDGFKVGDEVEVDFSLRGREWTSPKGDVKYFNSLDVWTVERAGAGAGSQPNASQERGRPGPGPGPAPGGSAPGEGPNAGDGEASPFDPHGSAPLPSEPNESFNDDIPF